MTKPAWESSRLANIQHNTRRYANIGVWDDAERAIFQIGSRAQPDFRPLNSSLFLRGLNMAGRKKVTIVGGGQTGGIMAYHLAAKNICDIVIKDVAEFAQHHGKALDIMQGGSLGAMRRRSPPPMTGMPRQIQTRWSSLPERHANPA